MRQALAAEIERRTATEMEPGEGPLDYIAHWIAGGGTLLSLLADVSETGGTPISRSALTKYMQTLRRDAGDRLTQARRDGAHMLAAEAMQIVDEAPADREEIAKARLRSDSRQWLASRFNKEAYGDSAKVQVAVNLGQLHLEALRSRAYITAPTSPALPAGDVEYEVVAEA